MLEILEITNKHIMWNKTILFAETCSWSAGPIIAGLMRNNQIFFMEASFCCV